MKEGAIVLKWIKNDKEYFKEIDRKKLFDLMNSIKSAFEHDNQISDFFCGIIPDVTWIRINKDRNEQLDIPFIEYEISGEQKTLDILRHHRIVWAILDGYTK